MTIFDNTPHISGILGNLPFFTFTISKDSSLVNTPFPTSNPISAIRPLWKYKPIVTSDDGDDEKDSGKGSNKDGSNDNNHRSSMDMDSNRGMGICRNRSTGMGNNMVQDRVASLPVNNTVPPQENERIG